MKHRLKKKGENWKRELPRPVIVKGGKTLRSLSDCRSYVLNLADSEQSATPWQQAAKLMLEAAKGGSLEDVAMQFERVLIHQNKLTLGS